MAKTIHIKHRENASVEVANALAELKAAGGGTLAFEGGEYHFYKKPNWPGHPIEGVTCFLMEGCENITVDGGGALFLLHDHLHPFRLSHCKNVRLQSFRLCNYDAVSVGLKIVEKSDNYFIGYIDPALVNYTVENGHLVMVSGGKTYSTADHKLSLHGIDKLMIKYLFAGDTDDTTENLPAPFMYTDAEPCDKGIKFVYRENSEITCPYALGETLSVNLEQTRERCVFLWHKCEDCAVKDVTVHRGGGMGMIYRLCKNVHIDGFRLDMIEGDVCTLTADAMYFVNCQGLLRVENCHIAHPMDDGINVHGNYFLVKGTDGDTVIARRGYGDGSGFCPFEAGHEIDLIEKKTMEVVGHGRVKEISPIPGGHDHRVVMDITGECRPGLLMEDASTVPDLELVNNTFYDYPNLRIIGGGRMLIEGNRFERGCSGLLSLDLHRYWYESGRIKDLTVRNNVYINATYKRPAGKGRCVRVGVDGFPSDGTPKMHERVVVEGNRFYGAYDACIAMDGVKDLTVRDNLYEDRPIPAEMILRDGAIYQP